MVLWGIGCFYFDFAYFGLFTHYNISCTPLKAATSLPGPGFRFSRQRNYLSFPRSPNFKLRVNLQEHNSKLPRSGTKNTTRLITFLFRCIANIPIPEQV
jgi:hypothetical protein